MADEEKKEQELAEITIHYEKTSNHHVVRADGFWLAITPQLEIELAAYNDLHPMPKKVRQKVTPEGGLGEELSKEVEEGISRQISVTLVMNPVIAKQVIGLLQRMLDQINTAQESKQATTDIDNASVRVS